MATKQEREEHLTEAQRLAIKQAHGDHHHALNAWTPGTPEYEEAEEELKSMMTTNPRLYTKIVNWD
jgi:hypothetical protein